MEEQITKALEFIGRAEVQLGEAMRVDSASIMAQIAQAQLLAVIAQALVEMNKRQKDQYINQP